MPKIIDINSVFHATVQIYAECGFDGTATKDIASRAGINEVTLYRRFGNKHALIQAALGHCLSNSPLGQVSNSQNVQADMVSIVQAYQETYRTYGGVVATLITEVAHNPKLKGGESALLSNLMNIARIIEGHQKAGRLKAGNPLLLMLKLVAPLALAGFLSRPGFGIGIDVTQLNCEQIADEFLSGHRV